MTNHENIVSRNYRILTDENDDNRYFDKVSFWTKAEDVHFQDEDGNWDETLDDKIGDIDGIIKVRTELDNLPDEKKDYVVNADVISEINDDVNSMSDNLTTKVGTADLEFQFVYNEATNEYGFMTLKEGVATFTPFRMNAFYKVSMKYHLTTIAKIEGVSSEGLNHNSFENDVTPVYNQKTQVWTNKEFKHHVPVTAGNINAYADATVTMQSVTLTEVKNS